MMDYRKHYYNKYFSFHAQPRGSLLAQQDQRNWTKATLGNIGGWLPEDRRVPILDAGCGTGLLLSLYEQLGYADLTGVDRSPEQIERGRIQCPGARIVQADICEFLADKVEQYELISVFDVIEHFRKEEILPFLELLFHSLRPGGRLILQLPNAESPWFGSVAYGDFTHEWFFTPAGLASLLRLTGFEAFQSRETRPHVHGLKSLVRSWLWRLIHSALVVWNLAETGGTGSGIYSRVFVATALKPSGRAS